jgi:hypothetical protein
MVAPRLIRKKELLYIVRVRFPAGAFELAISLFYYVHRVSVLVQDVDLLSQPLNMEDRFLVDHGRSPRLLLSEVKNVHVLRFDSARGPCSRTRYFLLAASGYYRGDLSPK